MTLLKDDMVLVSELAMQLCAARQLPEGIFLHLVPKPLSENHLVSEAFGCMVDEFENLSSGPRVSLAWQYW